MEALNGNLGIYIIVALVLAPVVAFIIVKIMASGLTSVIPQDKAASYYVDNSLDLYNSREVYRGSRVEKTPIPKSTDKK